MSAAPDENAPLQSAIDLAVARSFLHRWLAKAYEDPTPENWQWLCAPGTQENLRAAWDVASRRSAGFQTCCLADFQIGGARDVVRPASLETRDTADSEVGVTADKPSACPAFAPDAFDSFHDAYLVTFGHAARGPCPINELEYGELKADALFQPHRLADLAAFYRAFGLELADDAGERPDHLCVELEFMSVLAAKEAWALEHQLDADALAVVLDAEKKFLREHLGRWTPAFARRLATATDEPTLRALAEFTRAFLESECARFGVKPGSEELLLRPVDEAAERMCASCGIQNLPPGALATV